MTNNYLEQIAENYVYPKQCVQSNVKLIKQKINVVMCSYTLRPLEGSTGQDMCSLLAHTCTATLLMRASLTTIRTKYSFNSLFINFHYKIDLLAVYFIYFI